MKLDRYFKYFIVFNILLALPPSFIQLRYPHQNIIIPYFWQLFAAFAILNLLVYVLSYWGRLRSNSGSVKGFIGGTGFKFLLWMIIVFAYTSLVKVDSTKFLIDFFYLYLFNSVFEIYCLLRNLRVQNRM